MENKKYLDLDEIMNSSKSEDIKPVQLANFTRYLIYPDGKVYDDGLKRWCIMNRHMNFAMFEDKPTEFDNNGKAKPVLHNIRSLIKQLVEAKIPGFDKLLPEYVPPMSSLFGGKAELRNQEALGRTDEKAKTLHELRRRLAECTEALLTRVQQGIRSDTQQKEYSEVKLALDVFKEENPNYHLWAPYSLSHAEYKEIVDEIDMEIEEVKIERADLEEKIRLLRHKITVICGAGMLGIMGYDTMDVFKAKQQTLW